MNISIFVLPPLLTGLCTLALGLFVLLKSKSSDLARRFSLLCFSIMVWQFGSALAWSSKTSDIALFWIRLVYVGVAFIPALAYHLSVSTNELQKQKRWIPFVYLLSFLLLIFVFRKDFIIGVRDTLWGRHQIAGRSHNLFLFFWTLPLILSVFNFYYGYKSTTSPFERQRRRLVSVGFFIACLAGIDYLPSYGVEIPYPLGFIFILFFIVSTTYASVYYKALDVEVILKKISIITFLSIVAAVIIYIAPFYLQSYLYEVWGKNWIFFPISLAFLVGTGLFRLINVVRDMEESELSKKFAYRPILKREAERVSKARNINELLAYLTRDLSSWVRLDYVGVLVWDNHVRKFVLQRSFTRTENRKEIPTGLTLPQDNPLIVEL
ncbi:MAG: histidine kinase N-terminal 7TM domain-containing protein, partial [bacterium]